LNTLVISIALGSTIIGSLAFGIGLGYLSILGILSALSRNRAADKPAATAWASTADGSAGR
jgi:hypothetical protein